MFDIRVYAGFLDVIIGYLLSSAALYFTIFIFEKLVANFFEIFYFEDVRIESLCEIKDAQRLQDSGSPKAGILEVF